MDRTIFAAMRSQLEILRQARRVERLVAVATGTVGRTLGAVTTERQKEAKRQLAGIEVRRDIGRSVGQHALTVGTDGQITSNRQHTHYETRVTKSEKRLLPVFEGSTELSLQEIATEVQTHLVGLGKRLSDIDMRRIADRAARKGRNAGRKEAGLPPSPRVA